MALGIIAGAVAIGSKLMENSGARKADRENTSQARINAVSRQFQAADAIRGGARQASQVRKRARNMQGDLSVAAAAQGLDVTSGVAGNLADETEVLSQLDYATIMNNAYREAFGLKHNAEMGIKQAELNSQATKRQATANLITGGLGAAESIIRYNTPTTKKKT